MSTTKKIFTATVTKEDDWYVAQCREIEIASQGKSEREALANLAEALELYFEEPTPSAKPQIYEIEAAIR